jgi:hypothetical protein
VRRALVLLALCAAACAKQDAALLVTMTGQYRIPADGDKLVVDVFDGTQEIKRASWCASGCTAGALPAMSPLNASVTLVESGAAHPHVKINVELFLGTAVVGLGTMTADFQDGSTTDVAIPLVSP